ncbi:uncharacterized protein YfbU (UPF0304 family) [Luteibacter sp. W1I16]|uniref:YfbU family protein n=1 Tax=Luteibacter sp. W1I16 TaxID=3373922 RepID=UPI003D20B5D5
MELTDAEKLMLAMVAEMHQAAGIKNGINAKLIHDALWSGNEWAIRWDVQLPWSSDQENPPYVDHVVDVLDMWSFIEEGFAALPAADVQRVLDETESTLAPTLPGFDGNNETDEYSAARFLIDTMGRFSRFAGRDLNSHHDTIARSNRRLAVFDPIRVSLGNRHPVRVTADEIIEVVNA